MISSRRISLRLLDLPMHRRGNRNKLAKMALVKLQLRRLGKGRQPKPDASPLLALIHQQIITKQCTRLYRIWVSPPRVVPSGA
jgi:hypothetical protein